ncbi:hypothetical protein [Methylomonas koyamae]|uniref:hypothetical protein n=1 Tax=Methylomonas koyamae TaxID=702114 RepID=UPI000B262C7E|nr:hypothetical protein [Methylomonas koyamae]
MKASSTGRSNFGHFWCAALAVSVLIGGAMPVWNWLVNPYQVFDVDQGIGEPYTSPATNERYRKVSHLLNQISAPYPEQPIDCLLVGSSVMGLLDPRLLAQYFPEGRCYNLAFLAGRPGEILATLKALIAQGLPLKHIVYGLEPFAFSDPVNDGPANRLHPIVTGESGWKFYLNYLFEPSLGDGIGYLFDALNHTISVRYDIDHTGRYQLVRYDTEIQRNETEFVKRQFEQGRGPKSVSPWIMTRFDEFKSLVEFLNSQQIEAHYYLNPLHPSIAKVYGTSELEEFKTRISSRTGGRNIPDCSLLLSENANIRFYDYKHFRTTESTTVLNCALGNGSSQSRQQSGR